MLESHIKDLINKVKGVKIVVLTEIKTNTDPTAQDTTRLLILKPSDTQGPKVGLSIPNEEAYSRLDEAMGQLPESKRRTVEGIRSAASASGVEIVDF